MQLAPRQVTVLGCGKGDHWLDRMLGRKPDGVGNTLDKAGKLLLRKILPLASNSMLASNRIKLTHAPTVDQICNKIKSKQIDRSNWIMVTVIFNSKLNLWELNRNVEGCVD